MLLIALIACSNGPSTTAPVPTTPNQPLIVTTLERDDFRSIVGVMRANRCVEKGRSCVLLHYGILEDNTDYLFGGIPTEVDIGDKAADGLVDVDMTMTGQLWWVHPDRPLTAGLDGLGCDRENPCMAYLDGSDLNVWSPRSDKTFTMTIN